MSPILVILAGMVLGLGLLGMVTATILRTVKFKDSVAWGPYDPGVDEEDVDEEPLEADPVRQYVDEPAAPEWEPVCHYCGTGFDGDEKKCKHCGGRRLQFSPDLPGK